MQEIEKKLLDEIEGLGNGYDAATIEVPEFGSCFSYLGATSHIDDGLKPYDWYREMVLLGCRKLEFPDHYVSQLEAVQCVHDPLAKRSQEQWEIVERLRHDT